MKLRHSLRVYISAYVLLFGIGLQLAFAFMAYRYFFIGVDSSFTGTLYTVANNIEASQPGLNKVDHINLSTNWQDHPAYIRQQYSAPPQAHLGLQKVTKYDWLFYRPKDIYYAIEVVRHDGKSVYLSSHISRAMIDAVSPPMGYIEWLYVLLAAGVLSSTLILWHLLSKATRQVEKLKSWAEHIDEHRTDIAPPSFKYSELTDLAGMIHRGVLEVRDSVEREKNFLSYASHELRTPITTIAANIELIKRYSAQLSDDINKPFERIERAAQTMQHLTETLLWLSRKNEQLLEFNHIDLQELIQQICESLHYMLQGKAVTLDIVSEQYWITAKGAAVHIAVANIIKNAFQHTFDGHISIVQQGSHITIDNHNLSSADDAQHTELGFGLGLRLTQEIADTFNWHYKNETRAQGHHVELTLPESADPNHV